MGTSDRLLANKAKRREERTRDKELAKKRKIRTLIIVAILIVIVAVAGFLLLNSNFIRRTMIAVTIDGKDFTVAEYEYFLSTELEEYYEVVWQFTGGTPQGSGMLPDEGIPLRDQIYDQETGATWLDRIGEFTIIKMTEFAQIYSAAKEYGYVMSDSARIEMEEEIESARREAELFGRSFDAHLQGLYGRSMNEKVFAGIQEFLFTAISFDEYIMTTFTYTTAELDEFYNENSHLLDDFTYRYFFIRAEDFGREADYPSSEAFEQAKETALEAARVEARQIAAGIVTQEDYINAAYEFNPVDFAEPDSTLRTYMGELLGPFYGAWMRDPVRQYGDVTTADIATGSFVLFFIERDNNDRMTFFGERVRDLIAESRMRERDYNAWKAALPETVVTMRWARNLVTL